MKAAQGIQERQSESVSSTYYEEKEQVTAFGIVLKKSGKTLQYENPFESLIVLILTLSSFMSTFLQILKEKTFSVCLDKQSSNIKFMLLFTSALLRIIKILLYHQ